VRAVLAANVIISAHLPPDGPPARLIREWQAGAFELIVSDLSSRNSNGARVPEAAS
jgi:predicted nucleic acid-binding protein